MTKIVWTSFEDQEDEVTYEKSLYIFNYDPKNNTVNVSDTLYNLMIVNIYKNLNNEIIIVQENKVSVLNI